MEGHKGVREMQYIYEALIEPVDDGQNVTFPN
jgi:hypothetical protein